MPTTTTLTDDEVPRKRLRQSAPTTLRTQPRSAGAVATGVGTFMSESSGVRAVEELYAPYEATCGTSVVADRYACVVGTWYGVDDDAVFDHFDRMCGWSRDAVSALLTSDAGQRVAASALDTSNKVVQTLANALLDLVPRATSTDVDMSRLVDGTLVLEREPNEAARRSARQRAPNLLRLALVLSSGERVEVSRVTRFVEVCASLSALTPSLAVDVACNMDVLESSDLARLFVARASPKFLAARGVGAVLDEATTDLDLDFWAMASAVDGVTAHDVVEADRVVPRHVANLGDFVTQASRRFHVFYMSRTLGIDVGEAARVSAGFTTVAQFTRNEPAFIKTAFEKYKSLDAGANATTMGNVVAAVNVAMDDVACSKCSTMQQCEAQGCTARASPVATGAPSTTFVCSTTAGHFCKKCNITWSQKRKAVTTKSGNTVLAVWMEGLAYSIDTVAGAKLVVDSTAPFVVGLADVGAKAVCSASVKIIKVDGADGTVRAFMRYGTFTSKREIAVKYDSCRVTLETVETPLYGCTFTSVCEDGKTREGDATGVSFVWPDCPTTVRSSSVCVRRVVVPDTPVLSNVIACRLALGDREAKRTTLAYGTLVNAREIAIKSFEITKSTGKATKTAVVSPKPTAAAPSASPKSKTVAKASGAKSPAKQTAAVEVAPPKPQAVVAETDPYEREDEDDGVWTSTDDEIEDEEDEAPRVSAHAYPDEAQYLWEA